MERIQNGREHGSPPERRLARLVLNLSRSHPHRASLDLNHYAAADVSEVRIGRRYGPTNN